MSTNIASCKIAQEQFAEGDHPVDEEEAPTPQRKFVVRFDHASFI